LYILQTRGGLINEFTASIADRERRQSPHLPFGECSGGLVL
jgi:hypothetical protein